MGQRSGHPTATTTEPLLISVFVTPLGQWGLLGRDRVLWGLTMGHTTASAVPSAFPAPYDGCPINRQPVDWYPELRHRLERYSAGEAVSFEDIQLHEPRRTPFQQQVLQITRAMPYGVVMTYGELAAKAGHPRAARAVGTVMSLNRFPVIIPCHRIVGSGGGLGGYSNPQGIGLKERLLQMEAGE